MSGKVPFLSNSISAASIGKFPKLSQKRACNGFLCTDTDSFLGIFLTRVARRFGEEVYSVEFAGIGGIDFPHRLVTSCCAQSSPPLKHKASWKFELFFKRAWFGSKSWINFERAGRQRTHLIEFRNLDGGFYLDCVKVCAGKMGAVSGLIGMAVDF